MVTSPQRSRGPWKPMPLMRDVGAFKAFCRCPIPSGFNDRDKLSCEGSSTLLMAHHNIHGKWRTHRPGVLPKPPKPTSPLRETHSSWLMVCPTSAAMSSGGCVPTWHVLVSPSRPPAGPCAIRGSLHLQQHGPWSLQCRLDGTTSPSLSCGFIHVPMD